VSWMALPLLEVHFAARCRLHVRQQFRQPMGKSAMSVTLYPSNSEVRIRPGNWASAVRKILRIPGQTGSLGGAAGKSAAQRPYPSMLELTRTACEMSSTRKIHSVRSASSLEPTQNGTRWGVSTVGASAVKAIYKLVKRAIMGRYLTLHITIRDRCDAYGGARDRSRIAARSRLRICGQWESPFEPSA